jgi:hypothetical protein
MQSAADKDRARAESTLVQLRKQHAANAVLTDAASVNHARVSASARVAQSVTDQTRACADAASSARAATADSALVQQQRKLQSAADKARARAEAELLKL